MMLAAGLGIILGEHDAVGALQMIDRADVLVIGSHHLHVILDIETFEHVAPPVSVETKRTSAAKVPLRPAAITIQCRREPTAPGAAMSGRQIVGAGAELSHGLRR